ncbi:hypothetical protein OE88DRAFT_1532276 [Heliocybe sulcata]|uniref:Uncharacterized protein n=1 Tax=Heliocybe sulcata TaxID=5364 RepID=A0A5C3N2R4_9AGAM|nr:hypothetical protein OE88DRAFT_1532276 [Heliocybe sulcata]
MASSRMTPGLAKALRQDASMHGPVLAQTAVPATFTPRSLVASDNVIDEPCSFQFSGGYAYGHREYIDRFERGAVPAETATSPTIRLVTQPQNSPTALPHLPSIGYASDLPDHQTIQEKIEFDLDRRRERGKRSGDEMLLAKALQITNHVLDASHESAAEPFATAHMLEIAVQKSAGRDETAEWLNCTDFNLFKQLSQEGPAIAVETVLTPVHDAGSVLDIDLLEQHEGLGRELASLPYVNDCLASCPVQGEPITPKALADLDGLQPAAANNSNLTQLSLPGLKTVPSNGKTGVHEKSVKPPVSNGEESVQEGCLSPTARATLAPTPVVLRKKPIRILDEDLIEITELGWRSHSERIPQAPPLIALAAVRSRAALFRNCATHCRVIGEHVLPLLLPWDKAELELLRERARRNRD